MPDQNARIVRGLSIATVVMSSLAILSVLAVAVLVAVFGGYASDPAFIQHIADDAYGTGAGMGGVAPESTDVLAAAISLGVGIVMAALVWIVACSTVTLIAGIVGIRSGSKQQKLGTAFGWAIAGAAMSFLSGRLVTMALIIVSAVYLNKMRNYPVIPYGQPYPCGQPPYPYGQPYPYNQPYPCGQPYDGFGSETPATGAAGQPRPYGQQAADACSQQMPEHGQPPAQHGEDERPEAR